MSQRHAEAFETIEKEHEAVVVALKQASREKKKGSRGAPDFDPERLIAAIETAGDAYALLLIAAAEGFLREYLVGAGVPVRENVGLSQLIDQSAKELNDRSARTVIRPIDRQPMHGLRMGRNQYAHGRRAAVFPSVPKVRAVVSSFLHSFP